MSAEVNAMADVRMRNRRPGPPTPKQRLTEPLVRDNGVLRPATWDEALDRAAAGFAKLSDPTKQFGMFSCSKASNETNFLAQKFVRSVIGSNNIDSCNRT